MSRRIFIPRELLDKFFERRKKVVKKHSEGHIEQEGRKGKVGGPKKGARPKRY